MANSEVNDERITAMSITCSLVSTRMSPSQTCDDLPGPGRILDSCFYQPCGRFLEERLNRFFAKRQFLKDVRKSRMQIEEECIGVVENTFNGIQEFFFSRFSPPDGSSHKCLHLRWTRKGRESTWLDLSDYLYICGAQDIEGLGDIPVSEHCAHLNDFARPHHSSKVRARALNAAFCLLSSFPRLHSLFDIPSLSEARRGAAIAYDAFYHIIFPAYDEKLLNDFGNWKIIVDMEVDAVFNTRLGNESFRHFAELLPRKKISDAELPCCRDTFLGLILGILIRHEYEIDTPLADFLIALLEVKELFQLSGDQFFANQPVADFWKRVHEILEASLSRPPARLELNTSRIFLKLERCLISTLLSLPSQQSNKRSTALCIETESFLLEAFIRQCFEALLRIASCYKRYRGGRLLKLDESCVNAETISLVKETVNSSGRNVKVDAIWETCRAGFNRRHRSRSSPGGGIITRGSLFNSSFFSCGALGGLGVTAK